MKCTHELISRTSLQIKGMNRKHGKTHSHSCQSISYSYPMASSQSTPFSQVIGSPKNTEISPSGVPDFNLHLHVPQLLGQLASQMFHPLLKLIPFLFHKEPRAWCGSFRFMVVFRRWEFGWLHCSNRIQPLPPNT